MGVTSHPSPKGAASPPVKRMGCLKLMAFIVLALFVLGVIVSKIADSGPSTSKQPPGDARPSIPAPEQERIVRHKLGEDVFVGYWAYRCESAHWQNTVEEGGGLRRVADAKYLVVSLVFRNNDTASSILPPAKLLDDAGREHDESPDLGVSLRSLNPGVTGSGNLVFDVPPGKYSLKLSGGFASGRSALIDIPQPGK